MAALGSVPLRRHAPTLAVLGDTQDLAQGRWLLRFWRAEPEVVEDAADGEGVANEGDEAHALAAAGADERIDLIDRSYGNDWFVVPLTIAVGSITNIDSLVVTDTFGVRSLVRPIGDRALPKAHWSMWQQSFTRTPSGDGLTGSQQNLFFLPPSLARTVEGRAIEEVLFMRDEMANMAWAIERRIESGIEQPVPRTERAVDSTSDAGDDPGSAAVPRYLLSTTVPDYWIPLLPVQLTIAPGKTESRLRRGAVLQPDGSKRVHRAQGEVLNSARELLLYDEEIPREGLRLERRRQMTRWLDGSTWLWTAYRKYIGRGEGSSGLVFDRARERGPATSPTPPAPRTPTPTPPV